MAPWTTSRTVDAFTTPEEVATLVVFFASKRTANVTGGNCIIDGGLIKAP